LLFRFGQIEKLFVYLKAASAFYLNYCHHQPA
jgi:hypothetical protein